MPEGALAAGAQRALSLSARTRLRVESEQKVKPELLLSFSDCRDQGLSVWTRLRATANWPDAHAARAEPWREEGRASFDYGGVSWRRNSWSLFVGRDGLAWSSTGGLGLMFGADAPTFDMVKPLADRQAPGLDRASLTAPGP